MIASSEARSCPDRAAIPVGWPSPYRGAKRSEKKSPPQARNGVTGAGEARNPRQARDLRRFFRYIYRVTRVPICIRRLVLAFLPAEVQGCQEWRRA